MFRFVLLFLAAACLTSQAIPIDEKIQLDVYYESQCPDCYEFFVSQLRPTSIALSQYIQTNLVPYGNAKTHRKGDEVTFDCQHGESECLLNNIHACALERVSGTNLDRVLLASCLFDYYKTPKIAGKKCSQNFGLKWNDVLTCAQGTEGTTLMDKYGNETNSLNPPHTFVPTTAVNKYRGDDAYQNKLASNLKEVLCDTLEEKKITPTACK